MPRGTLHHNTKRERIIIWCLLFFILLVARGVWVLFIKHSIATGEQNAAEEELRQVRERYDELSQEVKKLETERGVEESIRDTLNVVKPGEKTVVLINAEEKEKNLEKPSFWDTIRSFFSK